MKTLYRSRNDRIVAGIIGGFAEYLHIPSFLLRVVFVLIIIASGFFLRFSGFFLLSFFYLMGIISIPISTIIDPPMEKKQTGSKSAENEIQGKAREISTEEPDHS
jgi:phage shock protein PspC (stress-responsive transcriptional regulator)